MTTSSPPTKPTLRETIPLADVSPPHLPCQSHLPSIEQYREIEEVYYGNLASNRKSKALIDQELYESIREVLRNPRCTRHTTAQFRYWVRKMFYLVVMPDEEVVVHDDKPVAVRERLYDILCFCHTETEHGGRDKTNAEIRKYYSWIPKDIVAQFVGSCPTCISRRHGALNHTEGPKRKILKLESQPKDLSTIPLKPAAPKKLVFPSRRYAKKGAKGTRHVCSEVSREVSPTPIGRPPLWDISLNLGSLDSGPSTSTSVDFFSDLQATLEAPFDPIQQWLKLSPAKSSPYSSQAFEFSYDGYQPVKVEEQTIDLAFDEQISNLLRQSIASPTTPDAEKIVSEFQYNESGPQTHNSDTANGFVIDPALLRSPRCKTSTSALPDFQSLVKACAPDHASSVNASPDINKVPGFVPRPFKLPSTVPAKRRIKCLKLSDILNDDSEECSSVASCQPITHQAFAGTSTCSERAPSLTPYFWEVPGDLDFESNDYIGSIFDL